MDDNNKRKVRFDSKTIENEMIMMKKQKKIDNEQSRLHHGKYTLDSDDDDDDDDQDYDPTRTTNTNKKNKNTNDDDDDDDDDDEEQDNQKQMNLYDLEKIEEEPRTIEFDDDVKITPFNIEEELEEGHYDESGCFQWKKKNKNQIRDAWLDEIDWTNVKNYKFNSNQFEKEKQNEFNQQSSNEDLKRIHFNQEKDNQQEIQMNFNEIETIQSMLKLMNSGEIVSQTIKRFGQSTSIQQKKQKIKQEKQHKLLPGEIIKEQEKSNEINQKQENENLEKNKKIFLEQMISLADQFVSNGDLDIYQMSYERLQSKLDHLLNSNSNSSHLQATTTFDMYSDKNDYHQQSISTNKTTINSSTIILWEYKNDFDKKDFLYGPFTTEQMMKLIENKKDQIHFDQIQCRRLGTNQFYSIKRIDFDLYLD